MNELMKPLHPATAFFIPMTATDLREINGILRSPNFHRIKGTAFASSSSIDFQHTHNMNPPVDRTGSASLDRQRMATFNVQP